MDIFFGIVASSRLNGSCGAEEREYRQILERKIQGRWSVLAVFLLLHYFAGYRRALKELVIWYLEPWAAPWKIASVVWFS